MTGEPWWKSSWATRLDVSFVMVALLVLVVVASAVIGSMGRDLVDLNQDRKAFMRECVLTQSEDRCLELYRWTR